MKISVAAGVVAVDKQPPGPADVVHRYMPRGCEIDDSCPVGRIPGPLAGIPVGGRSPGAVALPARHGHVQVLPVAPGMLLVGDVDLVERVQEQVPRLGDALFVDALVPFLRPALPAAGGIGYLVVRRGCAAEVARQIDRYFLEHSAGVALGHHVGLAPGRDRAAPGSECLVGDRTAPAAEVLFIMAVRIAAGGVGSVVVRPEQEHVVAVQARQRAQLSFEVGGAGLDHPRAVGYLAVPVGVEVEPHRRVAVDARVRSVGEQDHDILGLVVELVDEQPVLLASLVEISLVVLVGIAAGAAAAEQHRVVLRPSHRRRRDQYRRAQSACNSPQI